MRASKTLVMMVMAASLVSIGIAPAAQEDPESTPILQGPYLGQTPPGTAPQLFAPKFVSKPLKKEYGCSFTPDGQEFYFSREGNTWLTTLLPEGWSKPVKAPWNTPKVDMEPHVTPDGTHLWFSSNRKLDGVKVGPGLWVMERMGDAWGAPVYHGPGMYPTTGANGNLYFTDLNNPEGDRIAFQRFEDGQYGPMEPLGDEVNGSLPNAHPCISPDETFLVFDSPRPGGAEDSWHLFVTFRMPDGSWSQPQRIEETGVSNIASLSPDGLYLFFTRDGDIYWVSAEILEKYRPAGAGAPYSGGGAP